MRPSCQFVVVGVGVLIAFAHAASGVSQSNIVKPKPTKSLASRVQQFTAQASSPPSSSPATTPTTSPPSASPAYPGLPTQSQPIGPAKSGAAPQYLDPDPNPLSFPTRPEEVRLRGIQPITLQQALELSQRNNRELQVSRRQLERSRAQLREQRASLYPTVGANGGITQSQSADGQRREQALRQAQGGPNQSNSNSSLPLTGTVAVSYDIYTSGRRPAQIRAAEQQLRSDELQVEVTQEQLRLDTTSAYYNLQEADEAVRIQQSAVRNAAASLRDTEALERAGLGTRFDVLRARVQLANSQQDLTNAVANQQIRRRELAQILALSPSIDLAAADPVQPAGTWTLPLEESIVLAFKNRAELEQQLAQRELSEQQRKAALASLGPTVNLSVQYTLLNDLRDTVEFAYGYAVQAGFQWNFFDGGAARAAARQQEANIAIAEIQFADSRERIRLQVETAYSNLRSNFANIATSRQAVEEARESLRLARLRFQAGVGTQTDVINSENDLTRAEGNLVTAILNYNRALASLTRAITNLPIPVGASTPAIPINVPTSSPAAPNSTPSIPEPTPTPSPEATPAPEATPTPDPSPEATPTPIPAPEATPTPSPEATPSP